MYNFSHHFPERMREKLIEKEYLREFTKYIIEMMTKEFELLCSVENFRTKLLR